MIFTTRSQNPPKYFDLAKHGFFEGPLIVYDPTGELAYLPGSSEIGFGAAAPKKSSRPLFFIEKSPKMLSLRIGPEKKSGFFFEKSAQNAAEISAPPKIYAKPANRQLEDPGFFKVKNEASFLKRAYLWSPKIGVP